MTICLFSRMDWLRWWNKAQNHFKCFITEFTSTGCVLCNHNDVENICFLKLLMFNYIRRQPVTNWLILKLIRSHQPSCFVSLPWFLTVFRHVTWWVSILPFLPNHHCHGSHRALMWMRNMMMLHRSFASPSCQPLTTVIICMAWAFLALT